MIVPLSLVSTQRMKIIQNLIEKDRSVWYSNYAERPGKLFDTVNRPLTVFIALPSNNPATFSTNYQKWNSEDRERLFEIINYVEIPRNRPYFWAPKFTNAIETSILKKILSVRTTVDHLCGDTTYSIFYRNTGGRYWKVFTNFSPSFKANGKSGHSTRETSFSLMNGNYVWPMIAILSSDLFWWWYTITSNCRDLNPTDSRSFRIPESALLDPKLNKLGTEYLADLRRNSKMEITVRPTGKTETQTFKIQKSRLIIDQIDKALSEFYGFTNEELDFIQNYDIKFRMGDTAED